MFLISFLIACGVTLSVEPIVDTDSVDTVVQESKVSETVVGEAVVGETVVGPQQDIDVVVDTDVKKVEAKQ